MAVDASPAASAPKDPSLKRKKSKKDVVEDGEGEKTGTKKRGERKADEGDRKHAEEEPAPSSSSAFPSKKDKKKRRAAPEPTSAPPAAAAPLSPPTQADVEAYFKEHSVTITVPKGAPALTPALSFAALDVPHALRAAFAAFDKPTPVQACTWPAMLEGRDVVGIAETGSGKTLAFGVPALARLLASPAPKSKSRNGGVRVLIMAPTRELALQTHDTLAALGARSDVGIGCVAVFGGVDKGPQKRALAAGCAIVVGTPGRIKDLVSEGACDLGGVEYLVLDEADRMLDKGFENDIRTIIGFTRPGGERQTLMFSATWPDAVRRLASSFQRDPVRVTVGSDDLTANSRVEQEVEVFDDEREKDQRLLKHLQRIAPQKKRASDPEAERVLVFALYKKEAARVEGNLRRLGYSVGSLHGDLAQSHRMEALQSFRDGTTRVLVATDVAARGLDIPNVAYVLNYSFPLTIEDYIHRIGRTGRGGKSGKSITFFTGDKHERGLAGELARVLRESGFERQAEGLGKFPMTIKKKTHSAYGAFFRDDVDMSAAPTRIVFD
ncbi:P-loop containing nucleoside triphosphate hydrolase protein [Amylostereum chailletii]|nr:P-loop containing nucleoside triphosphate hydrolase protein [Amylostereum chailletii]